MDLRELIAKDLANQEKLVERYRKELKKLPKGSLYVNRKKQGNEYYFTEPITRKRTYVSKQNTDLLKQVRDYKIFSISKERMEQNIKVEKLFLNCYKDASYNTIFKELPYAYKFDIEKSLSKHSETKPFKDETLHMTSIGLKVRSKSEAIIVEALTSVGLEFRYEQELSLKDFEGRTLIRRPDFTFCKRDGGFVYWEHFGLLVDEGYRKSAFSKLLLYAQNRILPGADLFITADYDDGSIDISSIYVTIEMIKRIIE